MKGFRHVALLAACGLAFAGAAHAQTALNTVPAPAAIVPTATLGSEAPMTASNAASGVLDHDGVPTVDNATAGNIAGLMYYCYARGIDDDTTVRSLGRSLAKRGDVQSDATYPSGGAGLLLVGSGGRLLDLNTLGKDQRTATCAHAAQRGIELDDGSFLLPS